MPRHQTYTMTKDLASLEAFPPFQAVENDGSHFLPLDTEAKAIR